MTPTENNRCRIWLLAGLVAILLLPWFSPNYAPNQPFGLVLGA